MNSWQVRILFVLVICLALVYSIKNLTTKPSLWTDEAVSIDIARNFNENGLLDIVPAPGETSGFSHLLQSTGYPITIPLAFFFKIFGFGFIQARIYMLVWMVAMLFATFFFTKKLFGETNALFATALVASFASFYGIGRTVVGEVPGFVFLLIALNLWLSKKYLVWTGVFFSLALVSKPSVYGLVILALGIIFIFSEWRKWKEYTWIAIGGILPFIAWIFLVLPNVFDKSTWLSILYFYKNPFASNISSNFINNILGFPASTTLLYFSGLFLVIVISQILGDEEYPLTRVWRFSIIYCLLAFVYYLRSPGWLRYILIAEFLILIVISPSIEMLVGKLFKGKKWVYVSACVILVFVQFVQLEKFSTIFYSVNVLNTVAYVNTQYAEKSVFTENIPGVAALLKVKTRYQTLRLTGIPAVGDREKLLSHNPDVIIVDGNDIGSVDKVKPDIIINYRLIKELYEYKIYERI